MACSTSSADWRNLLPEIVLSTAEQLVVADIIRLRSVCVNWARALVRSSETLSFFRPSPWLVLPNYVANVVSSNDCAIFSIIEDRLCRISSLPQLTGRTLLGTSQHGWLVTIDHLLTPRFFNPLTKVELPLPSLITIPSLFVPRYSPKDGSLLGLWYNNIDNFYCPRERFFGLVKLCLKKIILSSSPVQGSIAVVLCTTGNPRNCLSFANVGGQAWSPYLKLPGNFGDFFEDVVFNEENNKLYSLTNLGAVFMLECRNNSIEVLSMVSMRIRETPSVLMKRYIFFSSGDLMQVTWNLHLMCSDVYVGSTEGYVDATMFKIFRFDPNCYNRHDPRITDVQEIKTNPNLCPYASCWVPVNDLGDGSLFIGSNNCYIIDCGDEQKRNKVFFLYDMSWLEHISQAYCVYDLKSNEIEDINSPYELPPAKYLPVWFMPTLTM
ncbi:hypothetical protein KSP39_PZI019733 [Platanthera zijinensis]|uniref:KIB1-4 beta-propeller domain-containing protein n=1 Tax=Platanthera zijinensis TaxID=2320716 RepID=A0AAP0B1H3_9ASPA